MARKLTTGLEGLGSVSQTRLICQLRINLDTCESNEKKLYFQKFLILYKRDLSSLPWWKGTHTLLANKVRANEGGESVACSKWLAPIHYLQTRRVHY